MKCKNCGNELTKDMNFCEQCGTPVPHDDFSEDTGTQNEADPGMESKESTQTAYPDIAEEPEAATISIKKDTIIKVLIAAIIVVVVIIAVAVFMTVSKNPGTGEEEGTAASDQEGAQAAAEEYDVDVWDYRLPEPPDHVSQKFYVLYYEKSRDNRIELSVFDIEGELNGNYIVWSGTGNPLVLNDQKVLKNCDQFYYDGSKWEEFNTGYYRLADSAKNVISSNLDIKDAEGKVVQPHITSAGISDSLDLSQYQEQAKAEEEKSEEKKNAEEKAAEGKTVEKIYVYPESPQQTEKIYVYPEDGSTGYILPGSDYRYISRSELYGFSALQLRLARNEIYARYGRMFKDEGLQNYFDSCSWYWPSISPDDFKESILNKYEKANVKVISEYEKDMGY